MYEGVCWFDHPRWVASYLQPTWEDYKNVRFLISRCGANINAERYIAVIRIGLSATWSGTLATHSRAVLRYSNERGCIIDGFEDRLHSPVLSGYAMPVDVNVTWHRQLKNQDTAR